MDKRLRAMKIGVKKLALGCPMDEPLPDCPANALRDLPFAKRLEAVDEMTIKELQEILLHHHKCLGMREN